MTRQWWSVAAIAGVTVGTWLGRLHPILELLTNGRPLLLAGAFLATIAFAITRHRGPAAVAALVVVIQAAHLAPYVMARPDPVPEAGVAVRAMQYNVYYGNDDLEAVTNHVLESDADVVALHELVPEAWANLEGPLADAYPHRYAAPLDPADGQLGGGMALLSRTPLSPVEVDKRYSPTDRVILAATTTIGDSGITVVGLHPHASRFESRKIALRADQMAGVVDLVAGTDTPVMVIADLNITPTSPAYQDFLDQLGWRDPHRVSGWDSTWPTWGGPLGFPIDHIFVSNQFALHEARTGHGAGSDHRSLIVDLTLQAG